MTFVIEEVDQPVLNEIMAEIAPYSQMSQRERYFLNGMLRHYRPAKILEVGVAEGGGSSIILNAIKDMPEAHLISLEYLNKWNHRHQTGWIVEEKFPNLTSKWTIHRGGDVSFFMEDVGGGIDMLVLDTSHVHPWETLNFLCILPFLKDGAWVVLHDISLQLDWKGYLACRYLFGHVVSENKLMPSPDEGRVLPNIGAFQITEDTRKYVKDLFASLSLPWGLNISQGDLQSIETLFRAHYPDELFQLFQDILAFQQVMNKNNRKLLPAFRTFLSSVFPGLYEQLRRIRRKLYF